jgi:transaldolase
MSSNPLLGLKKHGQSVWLDNINRELIEHGGLATLIRDDGVCGVTSNPAIFKVAMTEGEAYDPQFRELAGMDIHVKELFERMAIKDIQDAADLLREVFDASDGTDGFVSLEVSPHLAHDTRGTTDEALRLWQAVARPNVLIKIPGTPEGVPAIESCLAQGVNVNVTLLFSLEAYRQVIDAYFNAMETRLDRGESLRVASVASFFLSRIDSKVDDLLDKLIESGPSAAEAEALKGRAAVANAKLAYRLWREMFAGDRWTRLEQAGAHVQKPLWASTSTKNPEYSDVKYVETLIGPQTINTMPDETLVAFRDHGRVADTVETDLDAERDALDRLERLGIDMQRVTHELAVEGVEKFIKPFDVLIQALEEKRRVLAG